MIERDGSTCCTDAQRVRQIVSAGKGTRDALRENAIARIVYKYNTGINLIPKRYEYGPLFPPVPQPVPKEGRRLLDM